MTAEIRLLDRNETPRKIIALPVNRGAKSLGFYSPQSAARLARIPRQRLDAWHREGIVYPKVIVQDQDKEEAGYSFETLIYLRLLRILRDDKISLVKAVQTVKSIRDRFGEPGPNWAEVRIFRQAGHVMLYRKDKWEVTIGSSAGPPVGRGQRVFPELLIGDEFARMKDRMDALLVPNRYLRHIEVDPSARNGMPIIRGTTITTGLVHALRKQGWQQDAIRDSYPFLSPTQIRAAINYETFLDTEAIA
jgi:uncharacterized protein (DUF433 family)